MSLIAERELAELEGAVEDAFASGRHEHLRVLGYGEISSVIAWPAAGGEIAAKRLPPMPSRAAYDDYAAAVTDYLTALGARGVSPVETEIRALEKPDGTVVAYCIQPILEAARLGPRHFRTAEPDAVDACFEAVLAATGAIGEDLGLDGQLSNWCFTDAGPVYLDITTPMLRDAGGRERLDGDIFLASLPWALRAPVKRWVLGSILATYYDRRQVLVDFLANLLKEKLEHLIARLLPLANRHLERAIDEGEIRRYYRRDARLWAVMQRLRRADRAWQRGVRRRPYPFILPGRIER